MEILRRIKERLGKGSRGLGIGMALLVLASAFYFSRESFWEEAWTGEKREESRLIMIDAGHGGNDPGKVGVDGVLEKDLNLALAKKLKTLQSAARIPSYRFAAMEIPIPVPQIRIPFSHSPLKIAFATALPYSG